MAPRKRTSRVAKTNSLRSRKLASFLKDFDREGKGRLPEANAGWGAGRTDSPAW
jgi:borealin